MSSGDRTPTCRYPEGTVDEGYKFRRGRRPGAVDMAAGCSCHGRDDARTQAVRTEKKITEKKKKTVRTVLGNNKKQ